MAANTQTMAFQIPEDLFQRIKTHLERETRRTGHKLTQREFVLGLVEADQAIGSAWSALAAYNTKNTDEEDAMNQYH